MSRKSYWTLNPHPMDQLRRSLDSTLRQDFENIKNLIYQIGLQLNTKITTREQKDTMEQIVQQLSDELPDVFSGPLAGERLKYARSAIVRLHCQKRQVQGYAKKRERERRANKENGKPVLNEEILDLSMMDTDSDEEMEKPLAKVSPVATGTRIKRRSSTPSGPSVLSSVPAQTSADVPTSSVSCPPPQTSANISTSSVSCPPTRTSANVPSSSVSCPPGSSQTANLKERGLDHVHDFLNSCLPPLGHLLPRFVDLGFKSPEILKVIACQWSREERLELLKMLQVPTGSHSGEVSELELLALERRFQRYSTEALDHP